MAPSATSPVPGSSPSSSPATIIPPATTSSTTGISILKPVLLVLLATQLPIAASNLNVLVRVLLLVLLHLVALEIAVLLLAHDLELVVAVGPFGLDVERQERFLEVFGVELDEHAAFEGLVVLAPEADGGDGAVGFEEVFDGELGVARFGAEAFDVDGLGHGLVFVDGGDAVEVAVGVLFWEGLFALDGAVVVDDVEHGALGLDGVDDGG